MVTHDYDDLVAFVLAEWIRYEHQSVRFVKADSSVSSIICTQPLNVIYLVELSCLDFLEQWTVPTTV